METVGGAERGGELLLAAEESGVRLGRRLGSVEAFDRGLKVRLGERDELVA